MLEISNLSYSAGKKKILDRIDLQFAAGLFHVIVGPNGSGKSTLLKAFSGSLTVPVNTVSYSGKDIRSLPAADLARMRAVMSQESELYFPLSVYEIVRMGRYPFFDFRPSKEDERIIQTVMDRMEVAALSYRDYNTLSGGEKQRVQFARVLAQLGDSSDDAEKYLFLDEAVSNLDLRHQQQLLNVAQEYCHQYGVTVVAILHDLNLATRYADRLYCMKSGRLRYRLEDPKSIDSKIIHDIFDVEVKLVKDLDGRVVVVI